MHLNGSSLFVRSIGARLFDSVVDVFSKLLVHPCVAGWGGVIGLTGLLQLHNNSSYQGGCEASTERAQCIVCSRTFSNVYNLKVHMRDQHSGGGSVRCDVCGVSLKNPSTLRVHKSNYHVRCQECSEYFRNAQCLLEHRISVHAAKHLPPLETKNKEEELAPVSPMAMNSILRQYLQPPTFEDCITVGEDDDK